MADLNNIMNVKPIETDYQGETNLTRVLFTIQSDDKVYGIGIVGINHSPAELFYHSLWPKNAKRKLQDIATGTETKRPDHFSCHADGKAHMRTSKKGILGTPWHFPDGSFLPKDSSSVTLILIHSVKAKEGNYLLPLINEIAADSYQIVQQVAVIKIPQDFSISLFLVPTNISSNDILSNMWIDLRNLCSSDFRPGRLKVLDWPGLDVLVVLSDLIMPVPSVEPMDYFKIITVANPSCFEQILAQRNVF